MASYKIQTPCTVEDARAVATNNVTAFWEEDWWRLLHVNRTRESVIQAVVERTPRNLLKDREVRRHQMVVDTATGETVGYARWILSTPLSHEWQEAQTPDVSEDDMRKFEKMFAEADFRPRHDMDCLDNVIHEGLTKYAPSGPYIKLDYLGVRPDHQRRGIAGMLVASGIETANQLGVDIFLVAMGNNALGMYKKQGFEVLEERHQSLKPWGSEEPYDTFILIKHPSQ